MTQLYLISNEEANEFFLRQESYFNGELPSYFNFSKLLQEVNKIIKDKDINSFFEPNAKPSDFEDVNYMLVSNKDGKYAWRPLMLIHPILYVGLVNIITEKNNWDFLTTILFQNSLTCTNIESVGINFSPTQSTKSLQISKWVSEVETKSIILGLEFKYLFQTDIVDCYNSLYTHSIAWAIHGKATAKANRKDYNLIGNIIDRQLQSMAYGQTNGIPQGSVLMDFIAEIVLSYIDLQLHDRLIKLNITDYKIIRYRDDYRIFVNNPQEGETIIKELSEALQKMSMKINSDKTENDTNIIHFAIKKDKLAWIDSAKTFSSLQNELIGLSLFAAKHPNSGTVVRLLKSYYDKLFKEKGKKNQNDIQIQISIVTEIAMNNPRTYNISCAILSILISFIIEEDSKLEILEKIINKFKQLPNTGIMQVWLQRISYKIYPYSKFNEKLCEKVVNNKTKIWESDWLKKRLKNLIDTFDIVDREELKTLNNIVPNEEIDIFSNDYLSTY